MTASHILIPVHDFSHGGTERIAFRLAGEWVARGRKVTVLAGADDGPMAARVPDGAAIEVLSPPRPRSPVSRFSLGRPMAEKARKLRPDAIFLIGNFHFILGRAFNRALLGTPIVGKVSNPLVPAALGSGPLARQIAAAWTKGIDTFAAMSAPSRRELAPLVPDRAVVSIADPFLDDTTEIEPRSHPPERPLRLLFVGRLEPQKDPVLALEVADELRRRQFPFQLTILGSGALEERVDEGIRKRRLGDLVQLQSHVSDPSPFYRDADILLMTSKFEGVPAAIGEALAHGVPFVATPCSQWVSEISENSPACGRVSHLHTASALADAVMARQGKQPPTGAEIESVIGEHRLGRSASAYLELFDRLTESAADHRL